MNIKILHHKSKAVNQFEVSEWKEIDRKHYGREISEKEWKAIRYLLIVKDAEQIIGELDFTYLAGVSIIEALIIAKNFRGHGIGKMLMQKTLDLSHKLGAHKICVDTGKKWESVKFYEALGFKQTAEIPRHHFKEDFVQMTKYLTRSDLVENSV
ncbi:MAG: hypothetical protein UT63_C0063G0004 [Candidatus Gottesmanbacteria bacterium GW2011_GWC2_39_8]|uniref:N-acetyltransferase domain-containing protein n=1 Tax=Candidatus Gottesmanbacteria bacterium GW2011_GWC2_39_8 TaxID=1618450 RepID=A0A0G0Q2V4_9BACT|nr:MAG: hypothetical protein UT63_C0063G0004 [Candidatus Gottesmanbacteria bacterium GW2011_GWC2_39_8]